MAKQWGGRFEGGTNKDVDAFGESVSFDQRLAPWDIRASIAHAKMLGKCRIIPKKDADAIVRGLQAIAKDISAGKFKFDAALEDVHTNIENALTKRVGDAGKKLHTGRSRNDQVATDFRLWMRDQIDVTVDLLAALQSAVLRLAEKHVNVILPGCTHLQHAQPVLFAHHLLAYFEMFDRDRARFREMRGRVNILPLGSAALAGTTYPIDRAMVAKELKFDGVSANSMDAVSDRDFAVEFCSNASISMMHLSRLSEELIIWSSSEFAFIEIGDAFTTGSSIMPQKKNPDVAELVRGKVGRVYGSLMGMLTLLKGTPLTYNRDFQEDKPLLFDACDTLQASLNVVAQMLPSIRVDAERMLDAAKEGYLEATDLADYLAAKGMPFRDAHHTVGRIVLYCSKRAKRIPDLSIEELKPFSALFERDVLAMLTPGAIVARRKTQGGTAPASVRAALKDAKRRIQKGD
jgi:argininosuccinate lyase